MSQHTKSEIVIQIQSYLNQKSSKTLNDSHKFERNPVLEQLLLLKNSSMLSLDQNPLLISQPLFDTHPQIGQKTELYKKQEYERIAADLKTKMEKMSKVNCVIATHKKHLPLK